MNNVRKTERYSGMKDSGTAWLKDIPFDWKVSQIGSLYIPRNERVSDKEYPPLSVTMKGIVPQLASAAKTDDGDNRKLVRVGDFAINSRSDRRGSCGVSPYDGSVSLINTVLTPRKSMHSGYYNWLFHTDAFADEFYKWGHGIVDDLWTTRWQEMKRIKVPVPTYEVQQAIAAFLDAECSKLDEVIAELKISVDDYKQWRTAIITKAVTKGIDPTVNMKDSRIEWIGQIPSTWAITKATRAVESTQNGLTRRDLNESKGHIVLKLKNITASGLLDYSTINRIELSNRELETYMLKDGDFLFVRVNGSRNLVGKCAIFSEIGEPVAYNDHIIRVRLNKLVIKEFFYWYLLSDVGKREIELHTSTAAGQFTISGAGLRDIIMTLPPLEEQGEICTYLSQQTKSIDSLIESKQTLITDLELYKKSLIYEVVTGKRKVV